MKYTVEQIIEQDETQRQLDWNEQPYVAMDINKKNGYQSFQLWNIKYQFQKILGSILQKGEDIIDNLDPIDTFSCPPGHSRFWTKPDENGIMSYEDYRNH